jgi:CDP-diacylglycerol--glycerol-3-phosphate 3-phosphatidyltransferase
MDVAKRKEFLNLPNYISLARIISVPILVVLLMLIGKDNAPNVWNQLISFLSALAYGIASFSDVVDGFLARRYNVQGTFGKFFDPLADKVLNLAAMIMLIPLVRMPAWLVVLVLVREVTITMLRGVASNEHIIIQASKWGKYKNAFGSFGIAFIILYFPFFGVKWELIGWVLLLISVVFSVGSGIHYVWNFVKEISKR